MQPLATSARAPGKKNIQYFRYPSMYEPVFSPAHLKCVTYQLWEIVIQMMFLNSVI